MIRGVERQVYDSSNSPYRPGVDGDDGLLFGSPLDKLICLAKLIHIVFNIQMDYGVTLFHQHEIGTLLHIMPPIDRNHIVSVGTLWTR